jgi:nucleoside-diphosphate-sugar epimerase
MRYLVSGAAGALGSAAVRQLWEAGSEAAALVRSAARTQLMWGEAKAETFVGDVLDPGSVLEAADGCEVIFHCVNFPLDRFDDHHRAISNIVGAAAQAGASVVQPGNVWTYGRAQYNPVDVSHPQEPCSELGRLKLAAQEYLFDLAEKEGVRAAVVHLPDFYGPAVLNDFIKPIFLAALAGGKAVWPGPLEVPHELIYVDDAARALLAVARAEKPFVRRFNAPGAGMIFPRDFIEVAYREAGNEPRAKRLNRLPVRMAALFSKTIRRIAELEYLFSEPFYLDGGEIKNATGWAPLVGYEEGIRRTVAWFRDVYIPYLQSR